jgi:hypothetical protein
MYQTPTENDQPMLASSSRQPCQAMADAEITCKRLQEKLRPVVRVRLQPGRIRANRGPDVRLERTGCNVVAGIFVDCARSSVSSHATPTPDHKRGTLTAIDAARKLVGKVITLAHGTAQARAIPPHHLREVSKGLAVLGAAIWILGLFFVPAVDGGARELEPDVAVCGRGADAREVAAAAVLLSHITDQHLSKCRCWEVGEWRASGVNAHAEPSAYTH